jgi:two-component system, chemotaxis family, chemotaxis protein CheY
MTLADERLKELDNPSLTEDKRIRLRCQIAADLMHAGQYEAAREALGELWRGVGERPDMKKLPPMTAAEVLLQCGTLTGLLGHARNVAGAQEKAQDLLTEAARKFHSQGEYQKASEAQCELGACYWRLGAFNEARLMMSEALKPLADTDVELKAKILIRRTLVEISENKYYEALNILKEAEPVFKSAGDALKGRWHGQKGLILRRLATAEERAEYFDKAIIEYTAAIYHYEQAGHERYCATNLNNLAFLLYKLGRYKEAHENLDRAQLVLIKLKDTGILAQVDETRARVFLAEGKYREANRVLAGVIQTLEKGGESALLADALTVQGIVWARLGSVGRSIDVLNHAMRMAQDSGALTQAGLAALTLIEEHGAAGRLPESEMVNVYRRADQLLQGTQDAEDITRLRAGARIVIEKLSGVKLSDKDFYLPDVVRAYEAKFIREALEAEQGSITRAARRLGVRHQSLINIIKTRHKDLLSLRTPAKPRRRSIFRTGQPRRAARKRARPTTVMHVEDSKIVADTVRDALEMEGFSVVSCVNGATALRMLEGKEHYDLLILDNDLPHVSGVELIRRVRKLPHRRRTPIIMLSAGDVETEAWKAGVNAFLQKPHDIGNLTAMVKRLLSGSE